MPFLPPISSGTHVIYKGVQRTDQKMKKVAYSVGSQSTSTTVEVCYYSSTNKL